jgi:hypothetical protein
LTSFFYHFVQGHSQRFFSPLHWSRLVLTYLINSVTKKIILVSFSAVHWTKDYSIALF